MNRSLVLAKLVAVCSVPLLLVTAAAAQTTGQIEGTVLDQSGAALPGVSVEVISPALQGTRVTAADAGGGFRFVFLPPGSYTARCSLSGFSPVEQDGIVVQLGRTATLQVRMQPAFAETVTVSGAPPAVDVRSSEVGANVTNEFVLALPMQRDYASVAQITPGTTTDGSGVRTGPCG